jgi:hypothetical protein
MASPTPFSVRRKTYAAAAVLCLGGILIVAPHATAQRRVVAAPVQSQSRPVVHVASATSTSHVAVPSPTHTVVRNHPEAHPADRTIGGFNDRRNFTCANGTNISVANLINPTPSYGFDYQYLNSVNADAGLKAAIDPATEVQLREAARLGCGAIGGGGYLLWGGGGYAVPAPEDTQEDPASAPQPQVIVVPVQQSSQAQSAQPAAAAQQQEDDSPALPSQFVLVMRDGTQLLATAFMRSADTIVYITPDGLRRTITLSDLDKEATVRLNGERGTQLQLSL